MMSELVTSVADGLPVQLRAPHDLSFLGRWGRVFSVLDQQDSGNLCFGVDNGRERVFIKYAGARTARYEGSVDDAVGTARHAAEVYRDLRHPSLVSLRDALKVGDGYALVFDWVDAVPLGKQYGRHRELDGLSLHQRVDAVQQILDFAVHAVSRGWVAVDLYDASLLIDGASGSVTLCDIDSFRREPLRNTMGRMWGSDRFMAPEEYELGAVIDEITNVVALGTFAHTLLGDDAAKTRDAWRGSPEHWAVAARAVDRDRRERWQSVSSLADAWRTATAQDASVDPR